MIAAADRMVKDIVRMVKIAGRMDYKIAAIHTDYKIVAAVHMDCTIAAVRMDYKIVATVHMNRKIVDHPT